METGYGSSISNDWETYLEKGVITVKYMRTKYEINAKKYEHKIRNNCEIITKYDRIFRNITKYLRNNYFLTNKAFNSVASSGDILPDKIRLN